MIVKFLRERTITELKSSVEDNLDRYRSGNFDHLPIDPSLSFATDIELDEAQLAKLRAPSGDEKYDSENCAIVLKALRKLTPYEAADERLWTMLSHTSFLEHARQRWTIPKKDADAVPHIRRHFFASTQRQIERDNVAARLWWMAHLCARVEGLELKASLDVLLHRADVRANIIERPTTSQSIPVFSALLHRLSKSYAGKQKLFERKTFRNLMIKLNGLGGYRLLDALDSKTVEDFITNIIAHDLKLSEKEI